MNIAKPVVTRKLWLSGIWLLPLLSALVGGWVLYQSMIEKGIEISILFDNAEGIREGKTAIIYKGVRIGVVREVHISKNLKQVQARHATSRNSGTPVAIIRSPTQRMGDALNALRPQRLRTKIRFVITTSLAGRLFGMQFLLLSRAASTRRISELPCRLSGTKNHHFAKLRFHDFQRK